MNIDTEFNVGDSVCYLSGDNIIHTSISKITIEISYWKSHSTLTLLATQNYPFLLKYDCPLWLK